MNSITHVTMADITMRQWRRYLADDVFKQMMFVSGETGDPSPDATSMIEEIVRQQVVEIVSTKQIWFRLSNNPEAYPV